MRILFQMVLKFFQHLVTGLETCYKVSPEMSCTVFVRTRIPKSRKFRGWELCCQICSFRGYSSHPFRNYFHVNHNSYTAWVSAVDLRYIAYLLDLRALPRPFFLGTPPPPPPALAESGNGGWLYRLSTWPLGRRTVKRFPEGSNWALKSLVTVWIRNQKADFS